MDRNNIVILGGYGNFGKRIAESLSRLANIDIYICGRSRDEAEALCNQLNANTQTNAQLIARPVDIQSTGFEQQLQRLQPFLVIHTCGPFQGQNYKVAKACLNAGCHYIDLADDRRYVCDIQQFDRLAKESNLLLVSGASSVPGLSSAVIDHYQVQFKKLETIDFAIAPGNKAERGLATIEGILSYTGHKFEVLKNGCWIDTHGWANSKQRDFGGEIGKRWLADIDIPDLELFPKRYPSVKSVAFQAGLELPILHHGMSLMSKLVRLGLVKNWQPLAQWISRASNMFLGFGSDNGAMQVTLKGVNHNDRALEIHWSLYANNGVGPFIPTLSAIVLAQKLIRNDDVEYGAKPCLGLFQLEDFYGIAASWGIYHSEQIQTSDTAVFDG